MEKPDLKQVIGHGWFSTSLYYSVDLLKWL